MRISDWSSDVCSSDLRKGTNLVEIGPPERQIAGSGKMLLLDVEALAETEHRLICFQRSRYLGVLQCDPNIAAVDRAGAGSLPCMAGRDRTRTRLNSCH